MEIILGLALRGSSGASGPQSCSWLVIILEEPERGYKLIIQQGLFLILTCLPSQVHKSLGVGIAEGVQMKLPLFRVAPFQRGELGASWACWACDEAMAKKASPGASIRLAR